LHGLHGSAAVAIKPLQIRIEFFTEIFLVLVDPLFILAHVTKGVGKNTATTTHAYPLFGIWFIKKPTNPF
jgi:hypothetical protein